MSTQTVMPPETTAEAKSGGGVVLGRLTLVTHITYNGCVAGGTESESGFEKAEGILRPVKWKSGGWDPR